MSVDHPNMDLSERYDCQIRRQLLWTTGRWSRLWAYLVVYMTGITSTTKSVAIEPNTSPWYWCWFSRCLARGFALKIGCEGRLVPSVPVTVHKLVPPWTRDGTRRDGVVQPWHTRVYDMLVFIWFLGSIFRPLTGCFFAAYAVGA